MEKFIPVEKRSKKERKKLAAARRNGWNGLNPVSRTVASKKLYSRKKDPYAEKQNTLPVDGSCFLCAG